MKPMANRIALGGVLLLSLFLYSGCDDSPPVFGIFSEIYPPSTPINIGVAGDSDHYISAGPVEAKAKGVIPIDGTDVLKVDFVFNGAAWGGCYLFIDEQPSLESYSNGALVFSVNHSLYKDLNSLTIKMASGENSNEAGGVIDMFSLIPVITNEDWETYIIPLKDFNSFGAPLDLKEVSTYFGIWNPLVDQESKNGIIYIDNVYISKDPTPDLSILQ